MQEREELRALKREEKMEKKERKIEKKSNIYIYICV
jgi:hypothetical protein